VELTDLLLKVKKMINIPLKILPLLLAFSLAFASVPLAPRVGAGGKVDMFGCMQSNDYYIANFAAYAVSQQKDNKAPIVPQCQDLPQTGKTQIAIDLLDRDVRRKPAWLKIFDNHGSLIAQTNPVINKQGVITTTVNFAHQGQYDVVLYVEDNDLNVPPEISALHIPLTVAVTTPGPAVKPMQWLWLIGFIALFALAVGLITPRLQKSGQTLST
jgi:hypothetical protein